ncbi:poly [ADP-ribose] polymerase 2-like, partial [Paramuricea clavata]
ITGAGLVGTGAYLRVEKDDYLDLCDKYSWATGANILLAVGAIILVVAFFGCYGAWKQSSCLLGIFFVFLLIIFVLELAAGIYAATEKSKVEDELMGCLNGTLSDTDYNNAWKKFEVEFDCCGVNGHNIYTNCTGKWFYQDRLSKTTCQFNQLGEHCQSKLANWQLFNDKTKNHWEDKDCFEKIPGKYDLIIVDYNAEDKDETDAPAPGPPKPKIESKLDKRLQALIELICNVKRMEEAVKEMKYDTNKAPLGKLTKEQIKAGYSALKTIDQCISKNDFGSKLVAACDAFYTRIPHCFGMRQPPLIRTKDDVKLKIDLLEALGDIEIAMKILKEELDENPIDSHYKALKCGLLPIDNTSPNFKMIETYVKNTHAKTHSYYTMTVEEVFEIDHPSHSNFVDHGNRKLLWHGSRLTNWVGILTQGLRIAPPEAPVTGYM